jgi:hypothetical protein
MQNKKLYANATSGFAGVSFHKASGKWCAAIQSGGKRRYLGLFDTPETAGAAYKAAKASVHQFQPTVRGSV